MSMYAETVKQGAAATRRVSTKNPLQILAKLRAQDETASFEHLFTKWRKMIEHDPEHLGAALMYAYRNYWTALDRETERPTTVRLKEHAASKNEIAAAAKEVADRIKNLVLMELVLPTGKTLKESTFAECAKAGGWFARVAKLGKPSQIVGQTVNEERLKALKF